MEDLNFNSYRFWDGEDSSSQFKKMYLNYFQLHAAVTCFPWSVLLPTFIGIKWFSFWSCLGKYVLSTEPNFLNMRMLSSRDLTFCLLLGCTVVFTQKSFLPNIFYSILSIKQNFCVLEAAFSSVRCKRLTEKEALHKLYNRENYFLQRRNCYT